MKGDALSKFAGFVLIVLSALFLIKVLNISYPISIVSSTRSGELAVVGEGKVDVVPDTAYVDIGVTVDNASTVQDAQKKVTDKNNSIIDSMKKLGLPEENIKTSNFSIYPNYSYVGGKNNLIGYNANVTLSIKAKSTSETAQIITTATDAGANQVQGTRFVVDSPEKYREEARDKAIKNAREQAEKLAKTLGISLGRIVNIVESSQENTPRPPIMLDSKQAVGGGGGSPTLEPGQQTITSVVTLYFEKN